MNFFSFISLKTEIDKAYKNCLKKKQEVPEISKEDKEKLNKEYKAWHKNTYNPFLDYYNSSEK